MRCTLGWEIIPGPKTLKVFIDWLIYLFLNTVPMGVYKEKIGKGKRGPKSTVPSV